MVAIGRLRIVNGSYWQYLVVNDCKCQTLAVNNLFSRKKRPKNTKYNFNKYRKMENKEVMQFLKTWHIIGILNCKYSEAYRIVKAIIKAKKYPLHVEKTAVTIPDFCEYYHVTQKNVEGLIELIYHVRSVDKVWFYGPGF